jgi:predicted regulator of Ras-like GTPase activity (Roadblock/LC7/MglB family)
MTSLSAEAADLPDTTSDKLEAVIRNLQRRTQAEVVILADISGQLIFHHGQTSDMDPNIVAALGAGQLTAVTELARQIGDPDPRGAFLHEGSEKRVYLCSVASSFVVIVVFTEDVPVGLIRLFSDRAVKELEAWVGEFERWIDTSGAFLGGEWGDETEDGGDDDLEAAISDAFDEAFEGF